MIFSQKKIALFTSAWAIFLFLCDRLLKKMSIEGLFDDIFISDIINLTFVKNYNIAFSLPLNGFVLLLLVMVLISLLIYLGIKSFKKNKYIEVSIFFLIIMGASSNLWDRLSFGFVIDYIDVRYFSVFNLADTMIVLGVFLMIVRECLGGGQEKGRLDMK